MNTRTPKSEPPDVALLDGANRWTTPIDAQGQLQPPKEVVYITEVREYEVITPLFGGGVTPGEVDKEFPVNGKTIRGQLRFWWRAIAVNRLTQLSDLREAEIKIWGSASGAAGGSASEVKIFVKEIRIRGNPNDTQVIAFEVKRHPNKPGKTRIESNRLIPSYGAFPQRPEDKAPIGTKSTPLWQNLAFTLEITYLAEYANEVHDALWAWETFGGIGARTRRGFGAVELVSLEVKPNAKTPPKLLTRQELEERLAAFIPIAKSSSAVPQVLDSFSVVGSSFNSDPIVVWNTLIKDLQDFRQKPGFARDGQYGDPGRSHWPDGDSVRQVLGTHAPGHALRFSFIKFPRAAFGLPIVFHFKKQDVKTGDPKDTVLYPVGKTRMSSPLILRPIRCREGYYGLAVILKGYITKLRKLTLEGDPRNTVVSGILDRTESVHLLPLGSSTNTNVLRVFLEYLNL